MVPRPHQRVVGRIVIHAGGTLSSMTATTMTEGGLSVGEGAPRLCMTAIEPGVPQARLQSEEGAMSLAMADSE